MNDGLPTTLVPDVMQSGHAEVVRVLLEAPAAADVDKPTSDGYTPLALAARVSASGGIVMMLCKAFARLTHHAFCW